MNDLDRLADAIQLFLEFQKNPRPREAWLQANSDCRELLEDLLAESDGDEAEEEPGEVLGASSSIDGAVRIHRCSSTGAVESLGPYRVVEALGEGGMGTVYLAEQSDPIRRRVALKVIRLGMETKDVIARFEAERKALARMNHPNIAKVLEAGTTSDRCPYFVMELVSGHRMTRYCDENKLTLRQRVALFAQVCDGVQHAHQRGIIHRDLKPSNVLVSTIDGAATPKIIDFGIAKAFDQESADQSQLYTRTGGILGTPAYMSPEQLEPEDEPVDTRTDIYALGVLLHELLVGEIPFAMKSDTRRGFVELCRVVRHVDPHRPSTRIRQDETSAATKASDRSTNVRSLLHGLSGEIDWIILRCLEKDRSRRYESASGLADDLRRHLNHEPVLARPPSSLYRAKKLIRKNRGFVAACSIILLSLLAGLGWALYEKSRTDDKARELSVQVYRANLLLAADAIKAGQTTIARRLLDDSPLELRGWEWRHLESQLESSLRRFEVPSGILEDLAIVQGTNSFVMIDAEAIHHCDLETGEILRTVAAPGVPRFCSVDAKGEFVVVLGTEDDSESARTWVATWRLEDGERTDLHWLPPSLTLLTGDVNAESQRAIISGSFGLALFDLAQKKVIAKRGPDRGPWRTTFCPGGRQIILDRFGPARPIEIVDANSLETFGRLHGHIEIRGRAVSPDKTRLATVSQDGTVDVWNLSAALESENLTTPLLSWAANQDRPLHVAYSADGSHLITSGLGRSVAIWNAATGEFIDRFSVQENVNQLLAAPDSNEFISIDAGATIQFWPSDRRDAAALRGHESFVYSVSVDRTRGMILTGGWDGFAEHPGASRLWDLESGNPIAVWSEANIWCTEAMFLPNRNAVLSLDASHRIGDDPQVQFVTRVDLDTGSKRVLAGFNLPVASWCASPTQPKLWLITALGELQVLNTDSGRIESHGRRWYSGPRPLPFRIALSPDERTIVIAAGKTGVYVCRTGDLETVLKLPIHRQHALSMHFDAEGRRLLTSHEDGDVVVWDIKRGTELARLVGHDLGVLSARFSPDGSRIATGGRDKTVRIWSEETYELLATLVGHERYVYEVTWQDDGERLCSASGDGTVRIWETTPPQVRYQAQRDHQALVDKLNQDLDAWPSDAATPASRERFLSQQSLSARERQVAKQVLFARSLKKTLENPQAPVPESSRD